MSKKRVIKEKEVIEIMADENIEMLLQALDNRQLDGSEEFDYSIGDEIVESVAFEKNKLGPYVFGFIGAYAYDLCIYIGRNLSLLGRKVLVVDHTLNHEVTRIVRAVEELNEGEDVSEDIVEFCGIDVTAGDVRVGAVGDSSAVNILNYDVVLIDFGENVADNECALLCGRVYYVFDMYRHTAEIIKESMFSQDRESGIIFRDELPISSLKARRKNLLDISGKVATLGSEFIYHMPFTKDDSIARYMLEEEQFVNDSLLSDAVREFVDAFCVEISGDMPLKVYKKRIAEAKRLMR